MALSPSRLKSFHARSVSLPSRSHPLIPQLNDHVCQVKFSDATSSSLPSISKRLSGLENLYNCFDDILTLPHIQQILAEECHERWVDEALDGYLRLLDAFATTRDILSQAKEKVKEQLSVLRRRRDMSNFDRYLASRKGAKKVIRKLLKNLKSIQRKETVRTSDEDEKNITIISMLMEVETATLSVLESCLSSVVGQKVQSKRNIWSFVSKLNNQKSPSSVAKKTDISEFEKVDATIDSFMSDESKNTEALQICLGELESSIHTLEEDLDRLIRRLIKTRVSLLNILNH